ncbi:MAG: hypothetical protein HQL18_04710 [Candidatus Omnitrophica bacterium]|nr:hypothetical protein [Candidatus Omnitrophota bacterium]
MVRNNRWAFMKPCLVILVLVFLVGSFSGCATLRKKFTRKSKQQDKGDNFVPVLVPEEYQRVETSSIDAYKTHYAMARAYFKDMWEALDSRDSGDKQQKYVFVQVAARLQGMADLLTDEKKKAELQQLIQKTKDVSKECDKAGSMRRYDIMKSDMLRVERDVRKDFKPDAVKDVLKAKP